MEEKKNTCSHRPKLPSWIRVKVGCGSGRSDVQGILKDLKLNTVCSSAQCPNLNECWHKHTATFMILGDECTRNCKFCAVKHCAHPQPLDPEEPANVAEAAARLNLKYVVVTSVTRDDLPDGGAAQFAAVIKAVHEKLPEAGVEVLTPDFNGDIEALKVVLDAKPTVFNHNVETVRRLAKEIRSVATYDRSMQVLNNAFKLSNGEIPIKSGLMVGLGETDEEVIETIEELKRAGVSVLTIGQYLPPSKNHWPLKRYVEPGKFDEWGAYARKIGFSFVASAPLVRSSYNAGELISGQH
jgi:lipoic acid synthetase